MNNVQILMSIQVLVETILERSKFKAPAGYFEAIHDVIDGFSAHSKRFDDATISEISPVMSHPLRNLATGLTPIHALFTSMSFEEAAKMAAVATQMLADPELPFDRTVAFLVENVPSIKQLVEGTHPAISSPDRRNAVQNTGALSNVLGPHRFYLLGKPMFLVDQALCEGLIETSFGMDTPSYYLRAPLGYSYIEFGDKRNLDIFVFNTLSGMHQVEGCYIAETPYTDRMSSNLLDFLSERKAAFKDSPSLRYLELEFTGSPIGKENALDDATFNISLFVDDEAGLTVEEIYQLHVEYYQNHSANNRLFNSLSMDDQSASTLKNLLELLIKCLIFINSDLSVRRQILDRRELEKQLAGLKNPAKRRKLKRKINAAKDYILISSKAPLEYDVTGAQSGKSKSTHWRRGHFRNQRHGEGNSLVKIKWIQPTLVGVGAAQAKTYKVKE